MTDIYTRLNSLAKDLNDIPFISSGGCGITALELYKRMPTELQPRILVSGTEESNCYELVSNLQNGEHEGAVGHAFIGLTIDDEDYMFDPSGLFPSSDEDPTFGFEIADGILHPAWLAYMVADPYRWNPSFDRRHVPKIKAIARKHLGPVKRRVRLPVSANNGQEYRTRSFVEARGAFEDY